MLETFSLARFDSSEAELIDPEELTMYSPRLLRWGETKFVSPVESLTLINMSWLPQPVIRSSSAFIKFVFWRYFTNNLTLQPGDIFYRYNKIIVNYTDPEIYYKAFFRGFEIEFKDGTKWTYIMSKKMAFGLSNFEYLNWTASNLPMLPNVVFDNLPFKEPIKSEWYEKYEEEVAEHAETTNKFYGLKYAYHNLLEDYSELENKYKSLETLHQTKMQELEQIKEELEKTLKEFENLKTYFITTLVGYVPLIIISVIIGRKLR